MHVFKRIDYNKCIYIFWNDYYGNIPESIITNYQIQLLVGGGGFSVNLYLRVGGVTLRPWKHNLTCLRF